MKKTSKLLSLIILACFCCVLMSACGGEEVEQVNIADVATIKTADGVSYAYAETSSAAAKDLTQINKWYTDYYKDLRDSGQIMSLVVRYTDDPDHATFFTGINVFTGCEIDKDDNVAAYKTYEKWYRTESDRDRVLFEVEEDAE